MKNKITIQGLIDAVYPELRILLLTHHSISWITEFSVVTIMMLIRQITCSLTVLTSMLLGKELTFPQQDIK